MAIASVSSSISICTGADKSKSSGHQSNFPVDRMEKLLTVLLQALQLHKQTLVHEERKSAENSSLFYHTEYLAFLHEAQALGR